MEWGQWQHPNRTKCISKGTQAGIGELVLFDTDEGVTASKVLDVGGRQDHSVANVQPQRHDHNSNNRMSSTMSDNKPSDWRNSSSNSVGGCE